MAITYHWKVTSLKTKQEGSLNNVIVQTYWTKIGVDENGNTGEFNGATPFPSNNISSNDFTPFEELTEDVVVGWIKSVVTGDYEKHVDEHIKRQIEMKSVVTHHNPFSSNATTSAPVAPAPTTNVASTPPAPTPTPAPVVEPTPAPVVEPTPAPVVEPTPAPVVEPTVTEEATSNTTVDTTVTG